MAAQAADLIPSIPLQHDETRTFLSFMDATDRARLSCSHTRANIDRVCAMTDNIGAAQYWRIEAMRFFPVIFTRRTLLPIQASIMGLLFCTAAYSASPDIQADAGYMFDDNVTRAQEGGNKLTDKSLRVNLSQPSQFPISDHT